MRVMAKKFLRCLLSALVRVLPRVMLGGHKGKSVAKGAAESAVD